jgi:hypothetical protein
MRPVRVINPTAKLKDTANTSVPELSFQRQAVQEYRARQVQGSLDSSVLPAINSHTRRLQAKRTIADRNDTDEEEDQSANSLVKEGMLLSFCCASTD